MAKLAKDLVPGDRLSLTGFEITSVIVRGGRVGVTVSGSDVPKVFDFGQVVYLQHAV